ncbi:MAG: U32 family peptidase [Oscillospiraceae bacterium]|nr:U32 family peptidase [Oscillospiraceae bacterium]
MTELVLRTSSFEAVKAAVQNGAGGVKLRPEGFTPPGVKGISRQEAGEIIKYCRVRGAKVYITPGHLMSDAREGDFAALAKWAGAAGADAIVAESAAAAEIFKRCAPDMPVHGGFGMDIHSLEGVNAAAELGLERVCLSPQLDRNALRYICKGSGIEVEIKIHGTGCPAYGLSCRMGVFMDDRQPGFCAATCRENYGFGMPGRTRPLSMKEFSLGDHLPELAAMAPAALSVDSFTASPEYAALAARYYSRGLRERRGLDSVERENLKNAFYSQGCTDALYTGKAAGEGGGLYSPHNIFLAGEPEEPSQTALKTARETYARGEAPRVQVRFSATLMPGLPATLSVEDDLGHICTVESAKPLETDDLPLPEKKPAEPAAEAVAEAAPESEIPAEIRADGETAPETSPAETDAATESGGAEIPAEENAETETAETGAETETALSENPPEAAAEEPAGETETAPKKRSGDSAARTEIAALLYKTRGTPYHCRQVFVHAEGGAKISPEAIGQLQKKALEQLSKQRASLPVRGEGELLPLPSYAKIDEKPRITVSVQSARQLSKGLAELEPALVCVPVFEAAAHGEALEPFLKNPNIRVAVSLPRVIWDSERADVAGALDKVYALGVDTAEISNPGHAPLAKSRGFKLRAGADMENRTSRAMEELRLSGFGGAVLPVDMEFDRVRLLGKAVESELCVYGRLPLLTTQTCLMVQRGGGCACGNRFVITDDAGENYPVLRDGKSCRSVMYTAKKLWLADCREEWEKLGLWGARLCFTTENALECRRITAAYMGIENFTPNEPTRGVHKINRRPERKKERKNGRFR